MKILPVAEEHIRFPDPQLANEDGIVAIGGNLGEEYLLAAYAQGIFPWFNEGDPVVWWSPDPRMILIPSDFKVRRSLAKLIRNNRFEVKVDYNFKEVINECASARRHGQNGTWITQEMIEAYTSLHHRGFVHSFECYRNGKLAGGLYGLSLGRAFFGESMFFKEANASKVAFYYLVQFALKHRFYFIDAQQSTGHLASLGAKDVPRSEFLDLLDAALRYPTLQNKWELEK